MTSDGLLRQSDGLLVGLVFADVDREAHEVGVLLDDLAQLPRLANSAASLLSLM